MELLKALFESAELPAEFKEKTATLFEAAVTERLAAEVVTIQEAADKKLDEAKEAFLTEAVAIIDAVIEETVLEWAKENAVALDTEIKGQIAESFLKDLKAVFEKADIEMSGEGAGLALTKLQTENAELVKQADAAKVALTEAQDKLTQIARKEIIAEVTAGLADTQAHRATKLMEAFAFTSAEDFRAKAALVVEAVGGIKATQNLDGAIGIVDGGGKVSDKVTTPGTENEDGELVKKPAGNSVDSAEGAGGKPTKSGGGEQPGFPAAHADGTFTPPGGRSSAGTVVVQDPGRANESAVNESAPHLHSDLVAETLALFRR